MKSLPYEEFIHLFPAIDPAAVGAIYAQPFQPGMIVAYFEGWEFFEHCSRYIDSSEQRNLVWFEEWAYHLNEQLLSIPVTLNDFIYHCLAHQVTLLWTEWAADQLFETLCAAV